MRQYSCKGYLRALLVALVILSLTACEGKKREPVTSDPVNGVYAIYYKNTSGTELMTSSYTTESNDIDRLVEELLEQLLTQKVDDPLVVPVLGKNVSLKSVNRDKKKDSDAVALNFDESYEKLEIDEELLARAAIVFTLTQIPGVERVQFLVEGSFLVDDDFIVNSYFTPDNFTTDISARTSQTSKENLRLYFPGQGGDKLIAEGKSFLVENNQSIEKLILQKLAEAPSSELAISPIPESVNVLGVTVKQDICYVNFDENFLNDFVDANPMIVIEAIVDSLCEQSDIKQVQFMVNGNSDIKLQESISLSLPFSPSYEHVSSKEE